MNNNKKLKVLIIVVSIVIVLSLVIGLFGLSIISFLASIFIKDNIIDTTEGVAYLFEDTNTFIDSPVALSGQELEQLSVNQSLFSNNVSTDISTAIHIFSVGEANLNKLHTFGIFLDIDGGAVELTAGLVKANGAMASQIVKIQNGDSFFMNEAFTLKSVEFQSLGRTESLNKLLVDTVNGGNRIYMDDVSREKWIQFAPSGGARFNEETKLVTLSLEDATLGYIKHRAQDIANSEEKIDDEIHSGYDKEYEFSKLLLVDLSLNTVTAARTEYKPADKLYRIEYTMDVDALSNSDKGAGAIANLFGTDGKGNPNVKSITFEHAEFVVEVWENGLIKSVKSKLTWSGEANIMSLKARATDSIVEYYFTYTDKDCSDATIREKYYSNVNIRRKCSIITDYPDAPIIKDDRHDCTNCHLEEH